MTIKPFLTPERFDRALSVCAEAFGVPRRLLTSKTRAAGVIPARFALYAACYDTTGAGFAGVGSYVNRNHTSVMYGVGKAHSSVASDPDYQAAYTRVCEALR